MLGFISDLNFRKVGPTCTLNEGVAPYYNVETATNSICISIYSLLSTSLTSAFDFMFNFTWLYFSSILWLLKPLHFNQNEQKILFQPWSQSKLHDISLLLDFRSIILLEWIKCIFYGENAYVKVTLIVLWCMMGPTYYQSRPSTHMGSPLIISKPMNLQLFEWTQIFFFNIIH